MLGLALLGMEIAEGGERYLERDHSSLNRLQHIRWTGIRRSFRNTNAEREVQMGRTLNKKKTRKPSKPFNPKRDFVNEAIKDYLKRGGKIKKIIEEHEDYDQLNRYP